MDDFSSSIKVVWIALVSNIFLALIKFITGYFGNSNALIAEGANSSTDVLMTIIMLASLNIASQPQDKEHPYGHGKAETIAAAIVGLFIFVVAIGIIYGAAQNLMIKTTQIPAALTIYVAAFSIAMKEWLYRFTKHQAKIHHSIVLEAAAADHRSDQLTASTALVGIIVARFGQPIFDPLAAILIGLLIAYTAVRVLSLSVYQLMDGQVEDETIDEIINPVLANKEVHDIKQIRARIAGRGIFVDLTILMDPKISLDDSHRITEEVETAIKKRVPRVLGVITHVEPKYQHPPFQNKTY